MQVVMSMHPSGTFVWESQMQAASKRHADAMGSCHGTLKGSMDTLAGSVWQFYWLAGQGRREPARGPEPGANIFLGTLA